MNNLLSASQLIAIGYLSQPKNGGKTMEEIAAECGVSRRTVYNWLSDDTFQAELKREQKRKVMRYVPDVTRAMVDAAIENQNAAAAKLILQMAGALSETIDVSYVNRTIGTPDVAELRRMVAEIDDED